jgi:hypothetical protein
LFARFGTCYDALTNDSNEERVRVTMLPMLSDELLLDAYRSAVRLGLDRDFVRMLRAEIRRRRLSGWEGRIG